MLKRHLFHHQSSITHQYLRINSFNKVTKANSKAWLKVNLNNKRKNLHKKKKARKILKIIFQTNNQNQAQCLTVQDRETSATEDNKTERNEARARAQATLSNTIVNTLKWNYLCHKNWPEIIANFNTFKGSESPKLQPLNIKKSHNFPMKRLSTWKDTWKIIPKLWSYFRSV